ncbi:Dirigent protein 15 [Hibiscus syriacus]|uniref:Dirigent protein n=1 Tax=Hibiscus syriacus TaxID=106335 RepID=A0A6A2ZFM1_HIBSY|nr:Dirigent protein 15 [Hibiscus syriacus]
MTRLHFFLHDILSGQNPSAVMIARPNITGSAGSFGSLFTIDDPLTVGPEPTSEIIGNAQGMYVSSSRDLSTFTAVMYADFAFTSGRFNGSSFSLFLEFPPSPPVRELGNVGGRGAFRMASGFALLGTALRI